MKKISPLDFAHELEFKGVTLYMKLASRTENVLAKQVFYSLAGQEIEHARRIDVIQAQITAQQGWSAAAFIPLPKMEDEIKAYFKKAAKTQLKKGKANILGYDLAMKMEEKSYQVYEQFFKEAKNQDEKTFYLQMMKEENGHYEALSNVYAFLTDDVDWMRIEESKVWNWMNQ
jgi:rubrerythrin